MRLTHLLYLDWKHSDADADKELQPQIYLKTILGYTGAALRSSVVVPNDDQLRLRGRFHK